MPNEEYKAKKIGTYYDKYVNYVQYEYRGYTYDVEYPKYQDMIHVPAYIQHKDAQAKIDEQIERKKRNEKREPNPIDLDKIWEDLGWND